MSDLNIPDDAVEVRHLWGLVLKTEPDAPWVSFGTEIADPARVLLSYDYRREHNKEDVDLRIHKITVIVEAVDVEELREKVEQASAKENETAVQSE